MATEHAAQSGEAGHQGQDRQPGKNPATAGGTTPPPGAAAPSQVHARSKAAMDKPEQARPDMLHPGPDRLESEKTKGNLHHDQHEPQPDMQNEFKKL